MRDKNDNGFYNKPQMGRIGDRPYWILNFSILIRAVHQIGAAVFLTAYLFDAIPGPPKLYVGIVFVSGGLLLAAEWLRHRQIFREVAGMITVVKLLLLGAAYHGILPPTETILLLFFFASLGAHAPKKVRHRLLF